MNRVYNYLAPSSWIGVINRCCLTVIVIFGMNLTFAVFYVGQLKETLDFYFLESLFVGGPFAALFYASALYQHKLQRRLSLLSRKDGLTGLNNRRTFMDLASQRLSRVGNGTLFLLDADHFKRINDTYGHAIGDQCLEEIAHRLKWNLRINDVAGRIGGEEFAIFLAGATVEQARVIAGRIGQPITFDTGKGNAHETLTLSIGAVIVTPDQSLHSLLVKADDALYLAKRTGRSKTVFWEQGIDDQDSAKGSVA